MGGVLTGYRHAGERALTAIDIRWLRSAANDGRPISRMSRYASGKNSLGSQRDTSQKYSARAGPGGGGNWNDQVFSLWIQQTECKEHCGNGSVRPACDFGLQYEEIDEGVVVHAVSSGNKLIRFTRPMRRMSRGDEKRDGTAGQKLTMFRK